MAQPSALTALASRRKARRGGTQHGLEHCERMENEAKLSERAQQSHSQQTLDVPRKPSATPRTVGRPWNAAATAATAAGTQTRAGNSRVAQAPPQRMPKPPKLAAATQTLESHATVVSNSNIVPLNSRVRNNRAKTADLRGSHNHRAAQQHTQHQDQQRGEQHMHAQAPQQMQQHAQEQQAHQQRMQQQQQQQQCGGQHAHQQKQRQHYEAVQQQTPQQQKQQQVTPPHSIPHFTLHPPSSQPEAPASLLPPYQSLQTPTGLTDSLGQGRHGISSNTAQQQSNVQEGSGLQGGGAGLEGSREMQQGALGLNSRRRRHSSTSSSSSPHGYCMPQQQGVQGGSPHRSHAFQHQGVQGGSPQMSHAFQHQGGQGGSPQALRANSEAPLQPGQSSPPQQHAQHTQPFVAHTPLCGQQRQHAQHAAHDPQHAQHVTHSPQHAQHTRPLAVHTHATTGFHSPLKAQGQEGEHRGRRKSTGAGEGQPWQQQPPGPLPPDPDPPRPLHPLTRNVVHAAFGGGGGGNGGGGSGVGTLGRPLSRPQKLLEVSLEGGGFVCRQGQGQRQGQQQQQQQQQQFQHQQQHRDPHHHHHHQQQQQEEMEDGPEAEEMRRRNNRRRHRKQVARIVVDHWKWFARGRLKV